MDNPVERKKKLKETTLSLGFSLFGVADISGVPRGFNMEPETLRLYPRAVVLAKRLLDAVIETVKDAPNAVYFHHYRQLNFFLDRGAFLLSSAVQDMGYRALPIAASQIIDWENQKAHLSHKHMARLAGLGWIGRSNLLVTPEWGARVRLVTVLTDMPLEPDKPLDEDCGECRKCLDVCPASAIREKQEDFDHLACFEKLKEFRKRGLVGQYICGVCVRACPGKYREAVSSKNSSE
ncbi:MAG: epoxyqueuosine reductase [Candidatus Aminicenantes bacterium]|nr:epoxyqueuosine reductase [Candidatus Aminicenantes bacterium]